MASNYKNTGPVSYKSPALHTKQTQHDGPLDTNTYYHASAITIYPMANAVDQGKLFTEFNGRRVTLDITDINYVISPRNDKMFVPRPGQRPYGVADYNGTDVGEPPIIGGFDYEVSQDLSKVIIYPGRCMINGFAIEVTETISYRLPSEDEYYTGELYKSKFTDMALLCLHTVFDSLENLSGNIAVNGVWYCEGVHICYPTTEDFEAHENEYLLLGGIDKDGNIKFNDEKYGRIDAKNIIVRIEPDGETDVPPLQSTDLLTFINNFLHSYWVMKNGDNQYGDMIYRVIPKGYKEGGFDYRDEKPLTATDYVVKIGKTHDGEDDSDCMEASGYLNVKHFNRNPFHQCMTSVRPMQIWFRDSGIMEDDEGYNFTLRYPHRDVDPSNTTYLTITDKRSSDGHVVINSTICPDTYLKLDFTRTQAEFYAQDDSFKNVRNYLLDKDGCISATSLPNSDFEHQIRLSPLNAHMEIKTKEQTGYVYVKDERVSEAWKDVVGIRENLEITSSAWAKGFIVAGTKKDIKDVKTSSPLSNRGRIDSTDIGTDPSEITVPDFYTGSGTRKLQPGDIYATQVWSAVYNDLSEVFDVEKGVDEDSLTIPGMIVGVDSEGSYRVADRKKKHTVVGIISDKPAMCLGTNGNTPICLAGRVKVYLDCKSDKVKIGDTVGLSKTKPGHAHKCFRFSKYRVGMVTQILAEDMVEVLVKGV